VDIIDTGFLLVDCRLISYDDILEVNSVVLWRFFVVDETQCILLEMGTRVVWLDSSLTTFDFNSFAAEGNYRFAWYSAGGNYSRPHSLAAVGRRRIYTIYVGRT